MSDLYAALDLSGAWTSARTFGPGNPSGSCDGLRAAARNRASESQKRPPLAQLGP